mgnify:CR=1 FL=1
MGDLDGDGKLDLVFATGFVLAPKKQQPHIPQIQMNRSTAAGNSAFADEAEKRLPKDFAVQAGSVTAFDMDGDRDLTCCSRRWRGARRRSSPTMGKVGSPT